MSRASTFLIYLLAIFLQAGAYGLTFLLPRLFADFGADEKDVGVTLGIASLSTLLSVYYSGHLCDWLGRTRTLGIACLLIAISLAVFGLADAIGLMTVLASILLGAGWGLTYALAPILLTRLVTAEERVRYFAMHSVILMAGFGLSPVMTAWMEAQGSSTADAFLVIAGACVISAILFFILIKPVRHNAVASGREASSRLTFNNIGTILRSFARTPVIMVCLGASVFAGMNNFQTVFADARGLNYANFFLTYTITVVICRIALASFKGGDQPYRTIALLQYVMAGSVLLFIVSGSNIWAYYAVAVLFGIGYGASYPILAAMAAQDAKDDLVPQTMQLFALTYFVGIFGFPLLAGWMIVEFGMIALLTLLTLLATIEASMALLRNQRMRLSLRRQGL